MKWPSGEQWLYLMNVLVSRWINSGKNISTYEPENILCVKWDEIGDMVDATHVFTLLKKRFPNAKITVITKPYCVPLIESHPHVDVVLDDIGKWRNRYDFVIELRGTWKSLWRTFRRYPKVRLDRGFVRLQHRGKQLHETLTNFEIVKPILGDLEYEKPLLYPSVENNARVDLFLKENGIQKFAVIHCGARRELRRWPAAGFAEIAEWLWKQYGLVPVFAGVESEELQIQEVTSLLKMPFHFFTRNFLLGDLSALLLKASFFLGNESGPLQMADAAGIPLVGLFGPGVPDVFYPQGSQARVIHHVLDCNPCDQIHCVRPENPCIRLITIEEVKQAIAEVLPALNRS